MAVRERAPSDVPGATTYVLLALKATVVALRTMPALFGSAVLLCALVKLADFGIEDSAALLARHFGRIGAAAVIWLWGVVSLLLDACVLAPIAVAIHRMVLLRVRTPGLIAWNHARIWRFVGWTLLLELVMAIVAAPMFAMPEGSRLLATAVFGVPVAIISVRSLMIFPAVAVEAPTTNWKERIVTSWNSTRGSFWRLALALLGAILTLYLPLFAVGLVAGFFVVNSGSAQAYYDFHIADDLVRAALKPIDIALGAAVASWFYMWLHQDRDEAAAGRPT